MSHKKGPITDKESGLSSDQIDACDNFDQLIQWKGIIDEKILLVTAKLENAKSKYITENTYADRDWWVRVNGYKRVLGLLSQRIQTRISIVRRDKPKKRTLNTHFVDIAFEQLPRETYNTIMDQARARLYDD